MGDRVSAAARLPNFFVIGSMKSGTSSLYRYLAAHRQIFMPEPKEPDYFATQESFEQRREWYEGLFAPANGAIAVGEASTSSTKFPDMVGVPERIASLVPQARLIYLVRHPIERIRSQYLHELLMSEQREPIEKALTTHARYVNYSRYWMQLERFLQWFPPEQILVLTSDALRNDRLATLASVCAFLGVDAEGLAENVDVEYHRSEPRRVAIPTFKRMHGSGAYRVVTRMVPERVKTALRPMTTWDVDPDPVRIPDRVRVQLEDAVRPDMAKLRSYLGPDFDGWGLA